MYDQPSSVRIPKPLKDFLRRCAHEDNRKLSQLIIVILEEWRAARVAAGKAKRLEGKQ